MGGLLFTIHRTSTYRQRRNTRHKAIKHCHFGRGHLAIDSLTILGGKKNLFSIDADRVKEINRYADFLAPKPMEFPFPLFFSRVDIDSFTSTVLKLNHAAT